MSFAPMDDLPKLAAHGLLDPFVRVHGLAFRADLEIERGTCLTARVADLCDRLAGRDGVAGLLQKRLVVSVETHVAVAMIEHEQQPEPRQPVGVRDAAAIDRAHRRALASLDQHAVPFDGSAVARLAIFAREAARDRPCELALEARERLLAV